MGAGDGRGLDDAGKGVGRIAERVGVMADLVGGLAVNHGPLVEAEAAEEGGTRLHRLQQIVEPRHENAAMNRERGGVESDGGEPSGRVISRYSGQRRKARAASPASATSGPGCQRFSHAAR